MHEGKTVSPCTALPIPPLTTEVATLVATVITVSLFRIAIIFHTPHVKRKMSTTYTHMNTLSQLALPTIGRITRPMALPAPMRT